MSSASPKIEPVAAWTKSSVPVCHVLVWERESLILPVADSLGLGDCEKSLQGPQLLGKIARDASLRARVLASNPSLRALVDELAAL